MMRHGDDDGDMTPADAEAVDRIRACEPVLVGLEQAGTAMGLGEGELGHAGPPFSGTDEIPATVLNAAAGAAVHEGWVGSLEDGRQAILSERVRLRPNHELGTVSPMAGIVRPTQPMMRVEDRNGSGTTWATFAEKGRRVLRFGVYDAEAAEGLRFVEELVAPAVAAALPKHGLPVLPLVAEGLRMGDDVHQRNVGGMAGFLGALPDLPPDVRRWLSGAPQHFLNYVMASAKLCLDQARGIPGAAVVTALSRNGVDCAIQVAGTGEQWFRAPAVVPRGGFFEGYSIADAQPDMGDSAIVEPFGLGGCTAHTAPEIARDMNAPWPESVSEGQRMRTLFFGRQPAFDPALAAPDGLGLGLSVHRARAAGGVRIHTGIAHRDGAQGWIGIGVACAPKECFEQAATALAEKAANPQQEKVRAS
jgi:hypothetical protein